MQLHYRIVNVFTEGGAPLSGNPLCVFENGEGLDDRTMQDLARQLNLSETTFLLPSQTANARVRIFTPAYEMPFAGHPTLGSAFVCRALGRGGDDVKLEMQVGLIPVTAQGDRWRLRANAPRSREVEQPRAELARLLGVTEGDVAERPLWVNAGKEQLIVPLVSPDAVRRTQPQADAFDRLPASDGPGMALVFAELAPGRLLSRFFFPQGSAVLEDPATGSATAALGGWWLALGRPLPCEVEISQGEAVRRPSHLYLSLGADESVHVAGDVIELGRGSFEL